ncbi:hypothetical protein LN042_18935 [Kitasatospora sp. RB6PN24]|uniref:hypothetical protein n=1 Tax=Kitasatospora humi TaxID=2893891 RepID=UPI001E49512D|nr:hypothetical protein [Kitasatospora humi]MCC9309132.1 hypothetical protein [Kitasatospora humi]
MSILNDTEAWGLLLGAVTPWATALIQQPTWSKSIRTLVGALASAAVGIITVLARGDIAHAQTALTTVALAIVASKSFYDGLWQHTGAKAMEVATAKDRRAGW